jgi:hypothetical protein
LKRVECLVLEGRSSDALQLADRSLSLAEEIGRVGALGPPLERARGYALYQARRPDSGALRFEESLRLARGAGAQYEIALTLHALAETDGHRSADADELFEGLGVVATPKVPLLSTTEATTQESPNRASNRPSARQPPRSLTS